MNTFNTLSPAAKQKRKADSNFNQPTFIIDSREQAPYEFSNQKTLNAALPAGDYSLFGFETSVAVERKSLADYVKTVIHDRDRFRNEIIKLSTYEAACVVVEASFEDLLLHRYKSEANPNSVIGSTMSIIIDYSLPIYFLSSRQIAAHFVEKFLLRFANKKEREIEREMEKEREDKANV